MARKYEKQVAAGAALLDRQRPGWRSRINLAELDLTTVCCCVLGQVYGDFFFGMKELHLDDADAVDLGFCIPLSMNMCQDYGVLQREWLRQLDQTTTTSSKAEE